MLHFVFPQPGSLTTPKNVPHSFLQLSFLILCAKTFFCHLFHFLFSKIPLQDCDLSKEQLCKNSNSSFLSFFPHFPMPPNAFSKLMTLILCLQQLELLSHMFHGLKASPHLKKKKTHICANLTIFKSKLIFFLQLDYFFKLLYSSKTMILAGFLPVLYFQFITSCFISFFKILLDKYHGSSFFLISITLVKVFIMPFPKLRRFILDLLMKYNSYITKFTILRC